MKFVYTPKENKFSKNHITSNNYRSQAMTYFDKKNRDEVLALIEEINRRTEENYHLN